MRASERIAHARKLHTSEAELVRERLDFEIPAHRAIL
jgi:hypothetical protein